MCSRRTPKKEQRIASAAMQFQGKPLDEWAVIEEEKAPKTWSKFESWTRNLLSDPENRMQTAYMNIRDLRQKKGQTVRDLNNTLELWERDLDEALTDKAKAYHTFSALHPDLQDAVNVETHGKITSREQVTTIAQRRAERITLTWDENSEGRSSKKRKRSEDAMPDKDNSSSSASKKKKRRKFDKADNKSTDGVTCYTCGAPGHKSPDCPTKAADNQSKNSKAQS